MKYDIAEIEVALASLKPIDDGVARWKCSGKEMPTDDDSSDDSPEADILYRVVELKIALYELANKQDSLSIYQLGEGLEDIFDDLDKLLRGESDD